jgi:hypothetical protein
LSLFIDLTVRLEGAQEVQQPTLVGYTELVDAAVVEEVAAFTDLVELPEQQLKGRWLGTRQQLEILVVRTEDYAAEDVAHLLLRNHRGLVLGHAVAVRHHGIVEVTLVGNVLREVIHCDLDRGWVFGLGN